MLGRVVRVGARARLGARSMGPRSGARLLSGGTKGWQGGFEIQRVESQALKQVHEKEAKEYLSGLDGVERQIRDLQEHLNDLLGEQEIDQAKEVAQVLKDTVHGFYGEEHPVYASTLNNIGLAHRLALEWDQALENYTAAVRIYRDALGDQHINTVVAIENHAHTYKAMASTRKGMEKLQLLEYAKELFEEALETKKTALGDWNIQVGTTMQSLGSVLRQLGKKDRASQLVQDGSSMIRKILPREHAAVATAFNNLAYDQKLEGNLSEAKANYEQALEIRTNLFGDTHPETVVVMNNLAEVYVALEEPEKAAEIQQRILDIMGYEEDPEELQSFEKQFSSDMR